jgi:hypothetical protein
VSKASHRALKESIAFFTVDEVMLDVELDCEFRKTLATFDPERKLSEKMQSIGIMATVLEVEIEVNLSKIVGK